MQPSHKTASASSGQKGGHGIEHTPNLSQGTHAQYWPCYQAPFLDRGKNILLLRYPAPTWLQLKQAFL